jgi:hypothetical protein
MTTKMKTMVGDETVLMVPYHTPFLNVSHTKTQSKPRACQYHSYCSSGILQVVLQGRSVQPMPSESASSKRDRRARGLCSYTYSS